LPHDLSLPALQESLRTPQTHFSARFLTPGFAHINIDVERSWNSRIEFYETVMDYCPVRDSLDEIARTDPHDFAIILAGLDKLRLRQYHRPPLSKKVADKLFEMRHIGKLNTRILWFAPGRRIVLVHCIRNKGQAIAPRDLTLARERMHDWFKRTNR
jgi:phage-related protein